MLPNIIIIFCFHLLNTNPYTPSAPSPPCSTPTISPSHQHCRPSQPFVNSHPPASITGHLERAVYICTF